MRYTDEVMRNSRYIHVNLGKVPGEGKVRLKSADVVRNSPDLAIVNVEVDGERKGLRFDMGKQRFFDSLGSEQLDESVALLKKPLTAKLTAARNRALKRSMGQIGRGKTPRHSIFGRR